MKITKTKLKKIIKESLIEEKIKEIFKSGGYQQAKEVSLSLGHSSLDLSGIDLSEQNLEKKEVGDSMRGANLSNSILIETRFNEVDLQNANFDSASFSDRNISELILGLLRADNTKFIRCNLRGTNFSNTNKVKLKDYFNILDDINKLNIPDLSFNGNYLKEKGMKEGALIGKTIKLIEKEWLDNDFEISNERVSEIIKVQNN